MAARTRENILARRAGAVNSVVGKSLVNAPLDMDAMIREQLWKINGTAQAGIATATETGLSPDRFPIRIVISDQLNQSTNVDAVMKFWRLENANGEPIRFERKVALNYRAIENYYRAIADLDDIFWEVYATTNGVAPAGAEPADWATTRANTYANASIAVATEQILATIAEAIRTMATAAIAARRYMRLQINDNVFAVSRPHGTLCAAMGDQDAGRVTVLEVLGCLAANSAMLNEQYPEIDIGIRTMGAFCVANLFRYGLFEAYEGQEYYTLVCGIDAADRRVLNVMAVSKPQGAPDLTRYAVGSQIDTKAVKADKAMVQQSMGAIFMAGVNHYSFNHTTGGVICTGPLFALLTTAGAFTKDMTDDQFKEVTSLFYQVLHPVNKRAIANMFFRKSHVWTHGRLAGSRIYSKIAVDTFVQIRTDPHPAGAHKAVLTALVLKRVINAHLSPFLPWRESITECINACKEVLNAGARAHIGSHYYTGESGASQSSLLDMFLPDLAFFVQTLARFDTICMSPHLSPEVAARSDVNWQTLIKTLKGTDLSTAKIEHVQKFLSSAGVGTQNFDPEKEDTYAAAIQNEAAHNAALAEFL